MNYRLTPNAHIGLSDILLRIHESSPLVAEKWHLKFLNAFNHIGQWPGVGHIYTELASRSIRVWNVGPYLIFFRSDRSPIEVIAVEHGAQNLPRKLRPHIR